MDAFKNIDIDKLDLIIKKLASDKASAVSIRCTSSVLWTVSHFPGVVILP
jgi:hypothetical protein